MRRNLRKSDIRFHFVGGFDRNADFTTILTSLIVLSRLTLSYNRVILLVMTFRRKRIFLLLVAALFLSATPFFFSCAQTAKADTASYDFQADGEFLSWKSEPPANYGKTRHKIYFKNAESDEFTYISETDHPYSKIYRYLFSFRVDRVKTGTERRNVSLLGLPLVVGKNTVRIETTSPGRAKTYGDFEFEYKGIAEIDLGFEVKEGIMFDHWRTESTVLTFENMQEAAMQTFIRASGTEDFVDWNYPPLRFQGQVAVQTLPPHRFEQGHNSYKVVYHTFKDGALYGYKDTWDVNLHADLVDIDFTVAENRISWWTKLYYSPCIKRADSNSWNPCDPTSFSTNGDLREYFIALGSYNVDVGVNTLRLRRMERYENGTIYVKEAYLQVQYPYTAVNKN